MDSNYKIYLIDTYNNYASLDIDTLDFTTTFSISDITDISTRKDLISKNVKILGTKNNNKVFGNLNMVNRDIQSDTNLYQGTKPNRKIDCLVYENNMILVRGQLQVLEVDTDYNGVIIYTSVITGYLVNFFNALNDLELADLDYGDTTHTLTLDTIKSSWTGSTIPYIYPSIDYGAYPTYNNNYDFRNFRCGLYLKTYLDAIFKTLGYSYTSNFTNSNIFNKCYVPYPEKTFNRLSKDSIYYAFDPNGGKGVVDSTSTTFGAANLKLSGATSNDVLTVNNDGLSHYQTFKFARDVTTNGSVKIHVNGYGYGDSRARIGIYRIISGAFQWSTPIVEKSYSFYNSTEIDDLQLDIPYGDYATGFEFVVAGITNDSNTIVQFNNTNMEITLGSTVDANVEIKLNDVVKLKDAAPQHISAYKFLKDLLQVFNLYLMIDPENDKNFIIEPFGEFYSQTYNPKSTALDWSDKVDYTGGIKSSFNTTLPKGYGFKFKDDSSDYWSSFYKNKYNNLYGNFSITNNDGYSDVKNVEVSFSSTIILKNSVDPKIMPNIYAGKDTAREQFKSNLRLLYNNGIGTIDNYQIGLFPITGSSTVYSATNGTYNHSHHILIEGGLEVFNLQFGVPNEMFAPVNQSIFTIPNIYSYFYDQQLKDINNRSSATLDVDMKLDQNDISNLDFRTPIYLNTPNGNNYFKLSQVNYRNSLELSQVKLEKINI